MTKRLVATGLLILLAASCDSGNASVPTTPTNSPAPVTQATTEPGPEVARILNSLAAAGYPCEHVDVANAFVLANGAIDEAMADCGGENLDIAVFPTAEQAEEYGRQGGGPYAAGDGWVIVTETLTLAERIADALGGPPDSSSLLTASHPLRLPNLLLHELSGSDLLHAIRTYGSITADHG